LEVTTPAATISGSGVQDEVSVITPVTGLPPDSPSRLHNLPSLLNNPPSSSPRRGYPLGHKDLYNAAGGGLGGTTNYSSPPSTPSHGDMRIHIPTNSLLGGGGLGGGLLSGSAEDDISAMSSPELKSSLRIRKHGVTSPTRRTSPRILGYDDDDEDSRELTVYEEEDESSRGGIISPTNLSKNRVKFLLSPLKKSDTRPNNKSTTTTTTTTKPTSSLSRTSKKKDHTTTGKNNNMADIANAKKKFKRFLAKKRHYSIFTRTEYFKRAVDSAFDMIDVDKSGDVTLEELYAGLLIMHLQLAVYAGAPACRPASKEYVTEIFHLLDVDSSNTLSKEEFAAVMKILYSQVFTRIVIHWLLTLMIVPIISQYIIKYTTQIYTIAHEFWKDIDDELDPLQRFLWKVWDYLIAHVTPTLRKVWDYVIAHVTPASMHTMGGMVWVGFSKVPKGIWKSLPYTMLTLVQTSIALPWALNNVEHFFRKVAHGHVGRL